jgi:enterochelin esterase-like enzyme
MRKWIVLGLCWLTLVACEPFAPDPTQQVVIVTGEASPTSAFGNLIPASPTPAPSLTPRPSPTPTEVVIPTATVPPCSSTTGTLFETSLPSAVLGGPLNYRIYLPPCFFESGRRHPYLILLHGSQADATQWLDLGLQTALENGLTQGSLGPIVVILPSGGDYLNENRFDIGASLEDMILGELIPELERSYCIQLESSGRAIGGIGRGGFWAYSIGLRHPDRFSAIGGHSPELLPDNAPITHNPLALAERANPIPGLRLYLDNAQSDPNGANVVFFSNSLRSRGLIHTYVINPRGGADEAYWSEHLADYLTFYSAGFPRSAQEMPSCQ